MYVVRIACPKCSVKLTFRGTPAEIGAAVEVWNSRHQRAIHDGESGASAGSGRRSCDPGRVASRAIHPVQRAVRRAAHAKAALSKYPHTPQAPLYDCPQDRGDSLRPGG